MNAKIKTPNAIDVAVGKQIRLRRNLLGMSQTTLADNLGITFQQVQKYEKGTNRVGASRLSHISSILAVPVAFFFGTAEGLVASEGGASRQESDEISEFVSTAEGLALNKAFSKIESVIVRRKVVSLINAMAEAAEQSAPLASGPVAG